MKQYDYSKLKGRLKELGYTQEEFAKRIEISPCSLNLTLKNKRDFRQDEILKAGEVLHIPVDEFHQYFFANKL